MSGIKIIPNKLKGSIEVPPSKSLAHRAIICAALSKGISRIDNIAYSDDIDATIKGMEALGSKIDKFENYIIVDGTGTFDKAAATIDCKESGSTLRFLVPISIVTEREVKFVGEGNLGKRPLTPFYEIFEHQGIAYKCKEGELDLWIDGKLCPGTFQMRGDISSQFITGLLHALPLLDGDSVIELTTTLESQGYIDLTLQILELFGIEIKLEMDETSGGYQRFYIKGNQAYQPQNYTNEADYSQAAFYLVANVLGNDVTLTNLNLHSKQGDKVALEILESMGAKVIMTSEGIKLECESLQGMIIDASQCPDVIPVLSLACAYAKGKSQITNGKRLRIKECDRIEATSSQLRQLGVDIIELEDGMMIEGDAQLNGGTVRSYDDHRIAMMLAIASTVAGEPIFIDNKKCVEKSYPNFWEDFESLGGVIHEWDVEKSN